MNPSLLSTHLPCVLHFTSFISDSPKIYPKKEREGEERKREGAKERVRRARGLFEREKKYISAFPIIVLSGSHFHSISFFSRWPSLKDSNQPPPSSFILQFLYYPFRFLLSYLIPVFFLSLFFLFNSSICKFLFFLEIFLNFPFFNH